MHRSDVSGGHVPESVEGVYRHTVGRSGESTILPANGEACGRAGIDVESAGSTGECGVRRIGCRDRLD